MCVCAREGSGGSECQRREEAEIRIDENGSKASVDLARLGGTFSGGQPEVVPRDVACTSGSRV